MLDLFAEIIRQDYTKFSGFVLEKYFRQQYGERERVTEVSHWWDSKNENEIDLIALEKLERRATVAEIKRNPRKFNAQILEEKFLHISPLTCVVVRWNSKVCRWKICD
ncbi:MAG: DUF234 domain-containing protein [Prevotella sp.]|nr:DUF234 domain-containing protein [Prevotella sp.]